MVTLVNVARDFGSVGGFPKVYLQLDINQLAYAGRRQRWKYFPGPEKYWGDNFRKRDQI